MCISKITGSYFFQQIDKIFTLNYAYSDWIAGYIDWIAFHIILKWGHNSPPTHVSCGVLTKEQGYVLNIHITAKMQH